MLPYSATDALHSMSVAYGLSLDPAGASPATKRQSRIVRWLRGLLPLA